MNVSSHTTTQTTHRATLAGSITVTLDPACFGATLTLSATGRALTLALTPEQVAEMGGAGTYPDRASAYLIWRDLDWFVKSARTRLGGYPDELRGLCDDDYDLVRALARAMCCPECEGTGTIETYPPHGVEAYTGAGDPRVDYLPCDQCGGTGLARAYQETQP